MIEDLAPGVTENANILKQLKTETPPGGVVLGSGETFFDGNLSAVENLQFAACLVPPHKLTVRQVLEVFPFLRFNRTAEFLSGGQQRVLSIAVLALAVSKWLAIEKPWEELDESRIAGLWLLLECRKDIRVIVDSRSK
jgi:ABC-type multidrug transport system ATPase subunit